MAALPLAPGTWNIDPVHSSVQFSVRHLGISSLRGRFGDVSAALEVGESLSASALTATIGMGSIDTGNGDRDNHLRGSDFFNAEANPAMTFVSNAISAVDEANYEVAGDLTVNGTTRPVTLAVAFSGVEDNPFDGSRRAGFAASGRIDRTEFGIDWNVPLASGGIMLGKQIDITLDVQLVGPPAT